MASEILQFGKPTEREERARMKRDADRDEDARSDVAAAEGGRPTARAKNAVILRANGFTFDEISKQLGYVDAHSARAAYMATLSSLYTPESAQTQRQLQLARLETLLKSVWEVATDNSDPSHLTYNRRASEIIADISKLEGLNAPNVIAMVNPDADRLEAVVQHLHAVAVGDEDPEGDIFALEPGADGVYSKPDSQEVEDERGWYSRSDES